MRKILYKVLNMLSSIFKYYYRNRLRILAYHDVVDNEAFEAQIKYLSSNYSIITIQDVYDYLFNNKSLPKHPLLITFDDGDISVLEKGLPILVKYNYPACIFIITDLINTNNDFWFKTVRKKMKDEGVGEKEIALYMNNLKKISNKERIEKLKEFGTLAKKQLTNHDLKLLITNNIFIGNHSHTHPMIDKCTEEEISEEMENIKSKFEEWGLEGYPYFAYPNGNFTVEAENTLVSKDIEMAFLFDHKINDKRIDPMRISRITVDSDTEINEFKVKVSGLHSRILNIRQILGL